MLHTFVCGYFIACREPTIPPPTSLCSATSPINGGGKGNGTQAVPYDVNIEPNIRTPREGCPYKGFDKKWERHIDRSLGYAGNKIRRMKKGIRISTPVVPRIIAVILIHFFLGFPLLLRIRSMIPRNMAAMIHRTPGTISARIKVRIRLRSRIPPNAILDLFLCQLDDFAHIFSDIPIALPLMGAQAV